MNTCKQLKNCNLKNILHKLLHKQKINYTFAHCF